MGPSQSIAVGQSVGPASLGATSAGWAIPALGPTAAGGDLVVDWAYGPTLWTDLWPGLWTGLWTDLWPGPLDRLWTGPLDRSCGLCTSAGLSIVSRPAFGYCPRLAPSARPTLFVRCSMWNRAAISKEPLSVGHSS